MSGIVAETFLRRVLDDDEDARYDAAREFARLGREAIPQAAQWCADPSVRLREMGCYILGQVPDPENPPGASWKALPDGVPTLRRVLREDADDWVRSCAAAALSFHAAPEAIADLVAAASDPSAEVRRQVAHALGTYYGSCWNETNIGHKPNVGAALLHLMDDEDDDVRDWATFGIHQGGHDTPETRARLWQALDDANPDVQGEAADGLAVFGDRGFIPRLRQLLLDEDGWNACYFLAAEEFGDLTLAPAVIECAKRCLECLDDEEQVHGSVVWAVRHFVTLLGRARRPIVLHHARLRRRRTTHRRH